MTRLSVLLALCLVLTFGGLQAVNVSSTTTDIVEAGKTYFWYNNIFNASVPYVNITIQSNPVVSIPCAVQSTSNCSMLNFALLIDRVGDTVNVTFRATNVSVDLSSVCIEVFTDDYTSVCKNISVYVLPSDVNCSLASPGSSPVVITCQINRVFPTSVVCTLYKRFNGVIAEKINETFIGSSSSNSSLYSSTCTCLTSDILSVGASLYFVNVRNSLIPSSPGMNSSDLAFNQSSSVILLEAGVPYTLTNWIYNTSVKSVDWVVTSSTTTVVNCTMPGPSSCSSYASLEDLKDRTRANFTLNSVSTDLRIVCMVLDRQTRNQVCQNFSVYVLPNDVNCSLSSPGSSPVVITCQINKVFPTSVLCTLYKKFSGVTEKIETFIGSSSSSSSIYSSTCTCLTSDILSVGTSWYFVNVRNSLIPSSQGMNSFDLDFNQASRVIVLEAGVTYTLTNWIYNASVKTVDWVVTTSSTASVSCTMGRPTCSAPNYQATLEDLQDRTRANFTLTSVTADLRSLCMVLDRQTKGQVCQNFFVYVLPKQVTCSLRYGPSTVSIDCQIGEVLPGSVLCTFFRRQNSTDTVLGYSNGTGTAQRSTYRSTCSLTTPEVSWGLNQYFVNVRNSLFPSGPGTNSSITMFNSEIVSLGSSTSGSSVSITCSTGPALAQVIRLHRKGLGQELKVAYNSTSITHQFGPLNCSLQDEYICEVNSLQKTLILNSPGTCPLSLVDPQVNTTYACKVGGRVALPPIPVSGSLQPSEFTLLYRENGATYRARQGMYSAHYSPKSLYYGSVDLAVYDLSEEDSREYMFSIRSDQNEDNLDGPAHLNPGSILPDSGVPFVMGETWGEAIKTNPE